MDLDGDSYMEEYYLAREAWDLSGITWDENAFQQDMGYSLQATEHTNTFREMGIPEMDARLVEPEAFLPLDASAENTLREMGAFS